MKCGDKVNNFIWLECLPLSSSLPFGMPVHVEMAASGYNIDIDNNMKSGSGSHNTN